MNENMQVTPPDWKSVPTPEWAISLLALIQAKFDIWGRGKYTDVVEDLYCDCLKRLDPEPGIFAVQQALLELNRPPDISDIVQRHAALVSPAPTWEEAWQEVQAKMSVYRPSALSHPLISAAVTDMGGLDSLYHAYRENTPLSVLRGQFRTVYTERLAARMRRVAEVVNWYGVPAGRAQFPTLFAPYVPYRSRLELPEQGRQLRIEAQEHDRKMRLLEAQPLPDSVKAKFAEIRANLRRKGASEATSAEKMQDVRKELANKSANAEKGLTRI